MTAGYVKICPRCGHRNDELASACEKDGEFLGMVPAIPAANAPIPPPPPTPKPAAKPEAAPTINELESPPHACETATDAVPGKALYLDVEGAAQYHQVRDGWVVGQAHPTSTAEIQLSNLPGVNYVHRRHCIFEFRDGNWGVTTLLQPDYTNPSFLNDKRITPGERVTVQNGDKLRFASVTLRIRIIDL
jgi:hypothetical protein